MFPTFNADNLHTNGVLDMHNCPYVFVNQSHPVIHLLRQNESLLGVSIDTVPKMDNEWYKLARPLMTSCCTTVTQDVLSKIQVNRANLQLNMLLMQFVTFTCVCTGCES